MKYGVSFNCFVRPSSEQYYEGIGGAEDEGTNISYVSNDKDKLIDYVNKSDESYPLIYTTEHMFVGGDVEEGGKVHGVFHQHDGEEEYVVAILFENPNVPMVIE